MLSTLADAELVSVLVVLRRVSAREVEVAQSTSMQTSKRSDLSPAPSDVTQSHNDLESYV